MMSTLSDTITSPQTPPKLDNWSKVYIIFTLVIVFINIFKSPKMSNLLKVIHLLQALLQILLLTGR